MERRKLIIQNQIDCKTAFIFTFPLEYKIFIILEEQIISAKGGGGHT